MTSSPKRFGRQSRSRNNRNSSVCLPLLAVCATLLASSSAIAQSCPEPLAGARRLVLVTSKSMRAATGTARLFERPSPQQPWQPVGASEPVLLGRSGMAWGLGFQHMSSAEEPKKIEGDGRTPAGIYRIGPSFGFAASPRPGYQQIAEDTVCVDDPASLAYNSITSRSIVGRKVHGENMRAVQRYRRGLVVDYPTDAKARGGSCIFIHVRRSSMAPTLGCVALPEERVVAWQEFSEPGAVLAIAPREALGRLSGCLPPAEETP
jgi:L,D-peptidoglycan transpeptidase YkuD (ErfK/YbiS/YcfS/YnhG family)